jgi:hypothetical protein
VSLTRITRNKKKVRTTRKCDSIRRPRSRFKNVSDYSNRFNRSLR